jgi:hypothetical protein
MEVKSIIRLYITTTATVWAWKWDPLYDWLAGSANLRGIAEEALTFTSQRRPLGPWA